VKLAGCRDDAGFDLSRADRVTIVQRINMIQQIKKAGLAELFVVG